MFLKISKMNLKLLIFVTCFQTQILFSDSNEQSFIVKMDPDNIVNIFRNVINSKYINQIAEEMAKSAAKYFMEEVRTKKLQTKEMSENVRSDPGNTLVKEKQLPVPKPVILDVEVPKKSSPLVMPEIPIMPQIPEIPQIPEMPQIPEIAKLPSTTRKTHILASEAKSRSPSNKGDLDDDVAFALLNEPSPDGDDWVTDSLEIAQLKRDTPALDVRKINGKYFKRMF